MSSEGKSTTPQGGGRRPYLEVVEERRQAVADREAAVAENERLAGRVVELEQRVTAINQQAAAAVEQYHGAMEQASAVFEKALAEAELKVPEGALLFGCAHPYGAFPKDYSGTLVTDGTYWYCSFNHLRVGIQTRAGLVG